MNKSTKPVRLEDVIAADLQNVMHLAEPPRIVVNAMGIAGQTEGFRAVARHVGPKVRAIAYGETRMHALVHLHRYALENHWVEQVKKADSISMRAQEAACGQCQETACERLKQG